MTKDSKRYTLLTDPIFHFLLIAAVLSFILVLRYLKDISYYILL